MKSDSELLELYAQTGAQDAFSELVGRRVNLVYGAALRILNGDSQLAEDVSQAVFTELARKAGSLSKHPALSGWLYTSACFIASKTVRSEQRRKAREREALLMSDANAESQADWQKLRQVLDEAMMELAVQDRESIVRRYFEGKKFSEIGSALGLGDNAARMKVDRAMDRLRALLQRRGLGSSSAALALLLEQQVGAFIAPAGLAASLSTAATSGAGTASLAGLGLAKILSLGALLALGGAALLLWTRPDPPPQPPPAATQASDISAPSMSAPATGAASGGSAASAEVDPSPQSRQLQTVSRTLLVEDRLPELIQQPETTYPEHLAGSGLTGEVTVNFVVDAEGQIKTPSIASSSSPEFEAAALEALSKTTFTPGLKQYKTVSTRMSLVFKFSPTESTQHSPVPRSAP